MWCDPQATLAKTGGGAVRAGATKQTKVFASFFKKKSFSFVLF
jgi:hypothetical protein